jgi:multidrug efflux pump subunit AcrA (membrane-fusion protein)
VKISLENPSAEVKPGMFARVSLVVERRQGVVVLPRQVVIERGRAYVMVRDGSVARERAVTLGLANQERVEVTGGLHPGEEVVVVGQELLKEGDPIEVTKQGGRS